MRACEQTLAMGCWTPLEGFPRAARRGRAVDARRPPGGGDFSQLRGARGRPARAARVQLVADRRAQHGERARGDRGRAPRRRAGARRPSRRWQSSRASRAAWSCAARSRRHACTTISRTIRRRSRRRSTACAGASAARASSPCWSRARNTMRMGVHRDTLAPSLAGADAGLAVHAAGSGLGCRRGGRGARRARPRESQTWTTLARELRARRTRRRSRADHEQRRLRRPARQAARASS